MKIKTKKLNPIATIPRYAKNGDAGLDLYCTDINITVDYIEYKTGLAIEIPDGYTGLIFPRSSNSKKDLLLCNSVGIIDSGYRGEICLRFKMTNNISNKYYECGDAVGQLLIIPFPKIEFEEVTSLSPTERGEGGFGSTDAERQLLENSFTTDKYSQLLQMSESLKGNN